MDKKKSKQRESDTGLMKNGRSNLARAGRADRGQGIPRVMILAGVLAMIGAAWLYWPSGNSTPTGVGEQHTVVTSLPENGSMDTGTAPSSGDVDINLQSSSLTPEKTEEKLEEKSEVAEPIAKPVVETTAEPATKDPVVKKPAVKKPAVKEPSAPLILPSANGSYAVQTGSFGKAVNADKEADRLKTHGWAASVHAGNNSSGQMVFRVWIKFFKSRQDAQTFINQNSKHIPGAIPVHR